MASQRNVSRLARRFVREEDGAVAIIVALLLPLMIGTVALVEASRVYSLKNQLQITADASAMASVNDVPALATMRVTANELAELNMPQARYGDVLIDSDAVMGNWNGEAFIADGSPANAVSITTRGELPLLFASALRTLHSVFSQAPVALNPSAKAIALVRLDTCYQNGFVAGGIIQMNSSNTFAANFCVYGRGGVTMNSSNIFEAGTEVGMLSLSDLNAGGNNPGLAQAKAEKDIAAPAAGTAMQTIDALLAGTGPIPSYITTTVTVSQMPASPVSGTMYIYTGTAAIDLSGTIGNFAVVSDRAIVIKSNSNLRNVVLASRESVEIRSNVDFGDANFCDTGDGGSLIISGGAVSDKDVPVGTNSNITFYGVQVLSDGNIEMNSNLVITGASIQSTGNIVFNSQFDVAGCPDETNPNVTGGGTLVSQLVD